MSQSRIIAFCRKHSAAVEVAVGTLITCTFVTVFYYQGLRANRAGESVRHSFEVRSQIRLVYGKLDDVDTGYEESPPVTTNSESDSWKITDRPLSRELQRLRELVAGDSLQSALVDHLIQITAENPRHADFSAQSRSILSGALSVEYEKLKRQEGIENRFWQQNRILVRAGVLLLYFGLLVMVRVLDRKNRHRHELESSLRENDILTRAVMDGGKHGIIVTDKNRIVTVFNKAAERIYGYDANDFLGEKAPGFTEKVILKSELEEEAERLGREAGVPLGINEVFAFAIQKYGTYEKEWTLIQKNGTHIPISLTVTTLRDGEGKMYGFIAILQDISERKRLEQMQMEFISTVSHELRTPLTSIRGALGLLETPGMDPEKMAELISVAHRNSERLVKITNDILDVEKVEFGKLSLNPEPLDVEQFIANALEANQTYGDKYSVHFVQKKSSCDGMKVLADPDRLMQVMTNLLSNATKFSAPGSEIWVGAECRNSRVHFSVRDFGPGIPENFRGRIFDKFSQANPANNRSHAGSGLGLNISRRLVEAMGGSIRFETAMGKGTTFFFDLPKHF